MTIRAKVHCGSVTKRETRVYDQEKGESKDAFVYDASFFPVTGDTDENKRFFAATPSGQIQLGTMREDQFIPGKSYYVDFTPAEG